MKLIEITDDLTGAADSGSYFTARGRKLRICVEGTYSLEHAADEILSVNLSSRNVTSDRARQSHAKLLDRLAGEQDAVFMKKIGTGFRGNDAFELEGLLTAWPEYSVFIIDNAPDLGTFTLYGDQYCEGEILPKSLYAKDPIFPPTESYIPDILGRDTKLPIGLVDIDVVKGGDLLGAVEEQLSAGKRILVFDAITRADTLRIIQTLFPVYRKVFWTGSLGLADGLAEYLFGKPEKAVFPQRQVRCLGFCASAYEIAHRQMAYSAQRGLKLVWVDMDTYIEGDGDVPRRAAAEALNALKEQNVMLAPKVEKYSYQSVASKAIMKCFGELADRICPVAACDRLLVVGGETAQEIFRHIGVEHLQLGRALEPGVAQGMILDGVLAGKEFSLKGGSMGTEETLEKMMCRQEVTYG